MKKVLQIAIAVLFALVVLTSNANAQLTTQANIAVTVDVSVNSTISLTQTGGSLTFDPATGKTNNIVFNVTYNLGPTSTITLYTWFANPASALSAGSSNIPASAVSATFSSLLGAGAGVPCTAAPGVGNGVVDGAACQSILIGNVGNGLNPSGNNAIVTPVSTTYSLSVLNYAALKLPAGNFSGVLNAMVLAV